MPLISVVIPSWNRMERLQNAIESVLKQTFQDFELVVVDDGSSDSTQYMLENYSQQIKNIRLTENKGVSAARNEGIRCGDSKWVAFLDSDDIWHPDKLQKQIEHSRQKTGYSIHFTDEIWVRNGVRVNPKKKHQKREGWIFKPSLALCLMSPSTVMLKRDLFDQTGMFDESLPVCEDYDLWLRLTARHPVVLLNQKLMTRYAGHDDQLSQIGWGFDRYRVQSIHKILQNEMLKNDDRQAAIDMLRRKCEILINGYQKRNQNQNTIIYQQIRAEYDGEDV